MALTMALPPQTNINMYIFGFLVNKWMNELSEIMTYLGEGGWEIATTATAMDKPQKNMKRKESAYKKIDKSSSNDDE